MIGLDTNVLVRYLVDDDAVQSAQASHVMERVVSTGNPGFISVVVMAELAWVLERAFGRTANEIGDAIEAILGTDVLVVESKHEVFAAVRASRGGGVQFADALIGALAERAGCAHTLTFGRKASTLPQFVLVS